MNEANEGTGRLLALIARLRGENGCPWDRKQTPQSIILYLIEEAYELLDAIEAGDSARVCEELGDVLFQVLFITRLFTEKSEFTFGDVTDRTEEKMVRRHPHVFGTEQAENAEAVRRLWHEIKREENGGSGNHSVLASIPANMPALIRAYRISERAARTGFDWDDLRGVMDKAEEEWAEFNEEVLSQNGRDGRSRLELEFGDLLFTLANVARWAGIHPETALSSATRKFQRRFEHMETMAARDGKAMESIDRKELDRRWEEAKDTVPDR